MNELLAKLVVSLEDMKIQLINHLDDSYTTFIDGDHVELQMTDNLDSLLFQVTDKVIVWGYETKNIKADVIIKLIVYHIRGTIVFPYIDNEDDINTLLNLGFKEYDFKDDELDDEYRINKSYILERS